MLDTLFKNKDGQIVTWQPPNVPLVGWIVFTLVARFVPIARVKTPAEFVATAFLFTWSYLEIRMGESWFRRILGLIVMAGIIISHAR